MTGRCHVSVTCRRDEANMHCSGTHVAMTRRPCGLTLAAVHGCQGLRRTVVRRPVARCRKERGGDGEHFYLTWAVIGGRRRPTVWRERWRVWVHGGVGGPVTLQRRGRAHSVEKSQRWGRWWRSSTGVAEMAAEELATSDQKTQNPARRGRERG